jgi:hypothetical protein
VVQVQSTSGTDSLFTGVGDKMYAVVNPETRRIENGVFAFSPEEANAKFPNHRVIEVTSENSPWVLHEEYKGELNV